MNKLKNLILILLIIICALLAYFLRACLNKPQPPATLQPTPVPSVTEQEPETEEVFTNYNIYAVYNKPTAETSFTLNQPRVIYSIQNYHWNSAKGNESTGTIGLKDQNGKTYGPWETTGTIGQGGVPNAYWTCYPNQELPSGAYTITDSNPATWSQNSGSSGQGMSNVHAVK